LIAILLKHIKGEYNGYTDYDEAWHTFWGMEEIDEILIPKVNEVSGHIARLVKEIFSLLSRETNVVKVERLSEDLYTMLATLNRINSLGGVIERRYINVRDVN